MEKAEKKKKNGFLIAVVILIAIIVLAAAALAAVHIASNIKEKNREKEYGAIIEALMDCYINQDIEKYISLCYPGEFLELEADAYYDGSVDDLKSDLKANLKEENSSIKEYYGSQVEFKVKVNNVRNASSSDISSVKSQMNKWTESIGADEEKIKTAYRMSFDLSVNTTGGNRNVVDCYAMIVLTESGDRILWDWNFNNANWDSYTYYNED